MSNKSSNNSVTLTNCLECNNPITQGKYCSNACKQRAYRNRHITVDNRVTHSVKNNVFVPLPDDVDIEELLRTYTICKRAFKRWNSNNEEYIGEPSFECFKVLHKILLKRNSNTLPFDYFELYDEYDSNEELILKYLS